MSNAYVKNYLDDSKFILDKLDIYKINSLAEKLFELRKNDGRLFFLGLGGSAANAQHATNDFRKIAGIQAYSPTDNVAEFSARVNDEGLHTVFIEWLRISKFQANDSIFILSVGGGDRKKNISVAICEAIDFVKSKNGGIYGIVGRDGGYTAENSDDVIIIPTVNEKFVTQHSETFQSLIWHLLISHPLIKLNETKW